jgi:outer membrane receptor for ferrienterochelin and colicins
MDKASVKICIVVLIYSVVSGISYAQDDTSYYHQSLYELSQVRVTSEKKSKQKLSNTASTMYVITSEKIREKAYFTLEDALAELPGFQFRHIMGLNSYSFLRGLPRQNNAILVLIDGIQINELNSGGFYGGGQYNLANVERIEVLYGPASVIYGSNAISGVINIITKVPGKNEQLNVHYAMGNFKTYLTDLAYSHSGKKIKLQLSGMFKTSDKADLSNENNDNYWNDDLEIFETDYAFDAKIIYNQITAGVNYQNRRSSTNTHYPSVNTIYKGFGTLWNLQLVNAYLKHTTKVSENIQVETVLYNRNATVLGNSVKEVTDTGQTGYYRPNNLVGIESIAEIGQGRKMNFVVGFFGYFENLATGYSNSYSNEFFLKPAKPKAPDRTNNTLAGLFFQADYKFFRYWTFVPGLRFEYSTSYKQVITPRASLLWNKNYMSSKIIYARAYRAPKPWDFTSGTGNPDLGPEFFNSFEFSNTWFITSNIRTGFSVFNNSLHNGLTKEYTDDNSNFYWANTEKILTQGAETSIDYTINSFDVGFYYTYTNSVNSSNVLIAEIAPHTAMAEVGYKFVPYAKICLQTYYLGKRKNPKLIQATNSEYIQDALVTNLYFSILNYKGVDIQLIIKNLANTEYYHPSNLSPDRFRQPQRSFLFKMSYQFSKL